MMNKVEFDEALCKGCGSPLFLDKDDCKDFIEGKLKEGYRLLLLRLQGEALEQVASVFQ